MNNIRLEMKIKNNNLYELIYDKFYGGATEFSRVSGVSLPSIINLLNLKMAIRNKNGEFKKSVLDICDYFKTIPEVIFPDDMYSIEKTSHVEILSLDQLPYSEKLALEHLDNTDEKILQNDLKKDIEFILGTIPEREADIIKRRNGIDCEPETLQSIANSYGLSRHRIRHLEMKAIRRLRHPKRKNKIKGYMD